MSTKELFTEQTQFYTPTMEDEREIMELESRLQEHNSSKSLDKFLDEQINREGERRIKNREIIAKVESWRGKFKDLDFSDFGLRGEVMKDLYILGLVCMKCGLENVIKFPVFQFFNFSESVICKNCQDK